MINKSFVDYKLTTVKAYQLFMIYDSTTAYKPYKLTMYLQYKM